MKFTHYNRSTWHTNLEAVDNVFRRYCVPLSGLRSSFRHKKDGVTQIQHVSTADNHSRPKETQILNNKTHSETCQCHSYSVRHLSYRHTLGSVLWRDGVSQVSIAGSEEGKNAFRKKISVIHYAWKPLYVLYNTTSKDS